VKKDNNKYKKNRSAVNKRVIREAMAKKYNWSEPKKINWSAVNEKEP
jgi:hypothetical protein